VPQTHYRFFPGEYSEFDPRKLTQEDYDNFLYGYAKDHKKSTLNVHTKLWSILNSIYGLNIKIQLIKETDKFTDYISFSELQKVINEADKEVATIAAFMFCTGLRPVSVVSLEKTQLILNTPHPYLKNVNLKGGKRKDIVPLYPEIVVPLLKWYMKYKTKTVDGYDKMKKLFVSQRKKTSKYYISDMISRCSSILGRNITCRMLRKGLGVHTKELGFQDEVRRQIMGHSDVSTTIQAYSNYGIEDVIREIGLKTGSTQSGSGSVIQNGPGIVGINNGLVSNQQVPAQLSGELCPFCQKVISPKMIVCPHCWKDIKKICPNCKEFVYLTWERCAYCGVELKTKAKEKRKFEHAKEKNYP
jgi:integrase